MTDFLIREANPVTDYEALAALLNTWERQQVTAERLREWDTREGIRRRTVAVDAAGNVIGYGRAIQDSWMESGHFMIWVLVAAARRSQGIGVALYQDVLDFARQHGAHKLSSDVMDTDSASQQFAEKRGFRLDHHLFESTINLKDFDETPFSGIVEGVEATGIRLFSLAEAGNTEANLYKLWEVNYRTYLDDPASSGSFPDFPAFQKIISDDWFRPDGQILAADGDQYVGLSAVGYFAETNSAYNMMTGVLADYRGRRIALALKLMSIRAARQWGADHIRTNNDSTNAPMLAINGRLGYVAQPGLYRMVKTLKC